MCACVCRKTTYTVNIHVSIRYAFSQQFNVVVIQYKWQQVKSKWNKISCIKFKSPTTRTTATIAKNDGNSKMIKMKINLIKSADCFCFSWLSSYCTQTLSKSPNLRRHNSFCFHLLCIALVCISKLIFEINECKNGKYTNRKENGYIKVQFLCTKVSRNLIFLV